MIRYCTKCGAQNDETSQICSSCQSLLTPMTGYQPLQWVAQGSMINWQERGADKKIAAGICGVLLGGFGVHKFILGYTSEGVIQLLLGFCGVGWIIGLVEGIIYLAKSDEEFVRTYIQDKRGWF